MKRAVLVLIIAVLATAACASRTKVAVELSKNFDRLQSAAISANEQGTLADKSAVQIVKFNYHVQGVLAAVNEGWEIQVKDAWNTFVKNLTVQDKEKFATYITLITALLGGV